MKRVPVRLSDGRIIDWFTAEEFKDGEWVAPSKPVSWDDLRYDSKCLSEEELRSLMNKGSPK